MSEMPGFFVSEAYICTRCGYCQTQSTSYCPQCKQEAEIIPLIKQLASYRRMIELVKKENVILRSENRRLQLEHRTPIKQQGSLYGSQSKHHVYWQSLIGSSR